MHTYTTEYISYTSEEQERPCSLWQVKARQEATSGQWGHKSQTVGDNACARMQLLDVLSGTAVHIITATDLHVPLPHKPRCVKRASAQSSSASAHCVRGQQLPPENSNKTSRTGHMTTTAKACQLLLLRLGLWILRRVFGLLQELC